MQKKDSLLRRLIPWIIALAAIAALVVFVGIPLYAPQADETVEAPVISYYEGDAKPLALENDALRFELDPATTAFKLTEKATGREWLSNPEDAAKDAVAVSTNKDTLQSTLIVTYSSASGVIDFNNYAYSIKNGTYSVSQPDENTVSVTYSVGKIEKVYLLPVATTVERFTAFTDAMSKKDAKKAKGVYTLYKPDKVATLDNRDELLALYPALAEQELYVLKADTSENNKAKTAGYFEAAGYTQEDYELDQQWVAGAKENDSPVFNVTVNYRLEGGDFLVEVPYRDIRYRAEYPITYLTVLPMFGAAGVDDEGFMLIPEGGGALINYNNGKLNQNSYYANMYGWDYGSERTEAVSETENAFPVFGMTRNGGSFICIMEGAPAYGGVQADISLRYNSYNWVCAKYNVLHSDRYNVSAKTARLVYMFEKQLPEDTIVQRYRFVDSDSYVDMAAAYGDYLRQRYPELAERQASEAVPVNVELLGAFDKKVVKLGLPVDSLIPATTFSEAEGIIGELTGGGAQNLNVRFSGWCNGGVRQKVLTRVKVLGQLGGEKGMKALIAAAKDKGAALAFDGISCFAYRSGLLQGFLPFRDAARFTTLEQVILYPYSPVWYQMDDAQDPYYLAEPHYAADRADALIAALKRLGAPGVAFRDIGSLLSGNYNPKNTTTREQVLAMNLEALKAAREAGQRVTIKRGYDYALPYADLVTDMNLQGTEYSIIDRNVPFYQIALHGAVDYTGQAINLTEDWQDELLRCAEYGAGLNFTFMAKDAQALQDSWYSGYFGASWSAWRDEASALIAAYQRDMAGLNRARIVGHEQPAEGVAVTTYEGGRQVLVNYTEADFRLGGVTVPARSYLVTGGDQ
ncbi:MAG: hypothetical protein IKQ80_09380 [Clostridia bacterium]|nr:hypothetical protein [Clostridia bacterium]